MRSFSSTSRPRTSPKLPSLWDINRYFTITAGYSVGYQWNADLRQEDIGRSAGFSNKFTGGMILRWKSLTEPLFGKDETQTTTNRTGVGKNKGGSDSTSVTVGDKPSSLSRAFQFFKAITPPREEEIQVCKCINSKRYR